MSWWRHGCPAMMQSSRLVACCRHGLLCASSSWRTWTFRAVPWMRLAPMWSSTTPSSSPGTPTSCAGGSVAAEQGSCKLAWSVRTCSLQQALPQGTPSCATQVCGCRSVRSCLAASSRAGACAASPPPPAPGFMLRTAQPAAGPDRTAWRQRCWVSRQASLGLISGVRQPAADTSPLHAQDQMMTQQGALAGTRHSVRSTRRCSAASRPTWTCWPGWRCTPAPRGPG